jgi:hypothetical protein
VTDIVVIANEEVHPPINGGRVRMAALVDALRTRFEVRVHEPASQRHSAFASLSSAPRRGTTVLRPSDVLVEDARLVVYTHSYLEPVGPRVDVPVVVDFQNLEVDRQRSMASSGPLTRRASAGLEALKARRWEPRTARRAAIAIAVTEDDAAVLRRWGARRVVVVPNAATATPCGPSPADGPVTFFANMTYAPNAEAVRRLQQDVWPLVVARAPHARLRIAGRGTDDEVDDIQPVFEAASLLLAPVDAGGGTQLKVIEALAHGRVVVATTYSAASVPAAAHDGCIATSSPHEMADSIVALLGDVDDRHRRERAIAGAVPTWTDVMRPLLDAIDDLR